MKSDFLNHQNSHWLISWLISGPIRRFDLLEKRWMWSADSQRAADICSPWWRRSSPGSPAGTAWRPWPGWRRRPWTAGGWPPRSPWSPSGPTAPRRRRPAGRSRPAGRERGFIIQSERRQRQIFTEASDRPISWEETLDDELCILSAATRFIWGSNVANIKNPVDKKRNEASWILQMRKTDTFLTEWIKKKDFKKFKTGRLSHLQPSDQTLNEREWRRVSDEGFKTSKHVKRVCQRVCVYMAFRDQTTHLWGSEAWKLNS